MSVLGRIANLIARTSLDREIDAEVRSHIEMRTADNIAAGMSEENARRDAMLRFGNPAVMKERVAAADAALSLYGLLRDLRLAVRSCMRSPGFSITAVVTLALGIGANVVVFGVLDSLILHPLNVPESSRIFSVVQRPHGYDSHSYPDYVDFRDRNRTFSDLAGYKLYDAAFKSGDVARKVWSYAVSGNYFQMLGLRPQLGRLLTPGDEHGTNSAPYVVLSDAFWRRQLNADPAIVGETVNINKHPFTVIGVGPIGFHGTEVFLWSDFWVSIVNAEQKITGDNFLERRRSHGLRVMGKLRPGVTSRQATDDLNAIAAQLAKENPGEDEGLGARLVTPGWFGDALGDPARAFMTGLLMMALFGIGGSMHKRCRNLCRAGIRPQS